MKYRWLHLVAFLGGILAILDAGLHIADSAGASRQTTIIVVTTSVDELNSDGDCSLREALQAANTNAPIDACFAGGPEDIVSLPAGTYTLAIEGRDEDLNASGDLDILRGNVTISGASKTGTIIDGSYIDRVIHVHDGAIAELENLTVTNGKTADGIIGDGEDGGGIFNGGNLTVTSSVIVGNATGAGGEIDSGPLGGDGGRGGGVFNTGTMVVQNSVISMNMTGSGALAVWGTGGSGGDGGGIYNRGTLIVTDSIIRSNRSGNGGRGFNGGRGGLGGGIFNNSLLSLTQVNIIGNSTGSGGWGPTAYGGSGGHGGGIYNSQLLWISLSYLRENFTGDGNGGHYGRSGGNGGAVHNAGGLWMSNTLVADNKTGSGGFSGYGGLYGHGGFGGGLRNEGESEIWMSTFSGNVTGDGGDSVCCGAIGGHGGAISNSGSLSLTNSTISGNQTGKGGEGDLFLGIDGFGGGLHSGGMLSLDSTTVTENQASTLGGSGEGGGIYTSLAEVKNSIIAGNSDNTGSNDCAGSVISMGYNLVEFVGACSFALRTDIVSADPLLANLGIRGGVTPTHALPPDSPAIDQGSCGDLNRDQRGYPRPADLPQVENADDGCDIGSYEYLPHRTFQPITTHSLHKESLLR